MEEFANSGNLAGFLRKFKGAVKIPKGKKGLRFTSKPFTPFEVDKLRLTMLKTRKPGTVRNTLELLRRLINFGVKKQLCQGPAFTIELPKAHSLKTEDLTPEQLSRLLEAISEASNIQAAAFMKMALFTGMSGGSSFACSGQTLTSSNLLSIGLTSFQYL
ncbi:MAG: hypothetical protein QME75_06925 [Deltaproteobacteria bacterium]|nr:hypothetical protein [Deltaproteobacteria bacterium]